MNVPDGWRMNNTYQLKPISEIAKVITSPVDKKSLPDELPVFLCNYTDVYYNSVISKNMNFMGATAKQSEIDRFSLKPKDVVITKDSESADDIGVSTYIESVKDNLLCGYHLTILRPKKNIDGRFLSYALCHPRIAYNFYRYANGITRFGLTVETYKKVKILLPPLPEQKAIAELLSTWDEAIKKTERLIQMKEKRFKGYVQRLIDQRCTEWRHIKPKKIFNTITEKNYPEELLSVTQDRGVIPRSMLEGRVMSPNGTTASYKLIKSGDFVISLRSFQGGVEYSNYQGIISPAYTVLRPKIDINTEFYRHFFKTYIFIEKYLNLAVIGIRDGKQISIPDFMSIKIPGPPLEEQKQIAETLSTAQQEIDLLKQLAEKYKIQKRGLMQKLLTGDWQIKPEILNKYKEA